MDDLAAMLPALKRLNPRRISLGGQHISDRSIETAQPVAVPAFDQPRRNTGQAARPWAAAPRSFRMIVTPSMRQIDPDFVIDEVPDP